MLPLAVRHVAEKLSDGGAPIAAFEQLKAQSDFISSSSWCAAGLGGSSGIALFFGALERADGSGPWASIAHEHLKTAARDEHGAAGLYGGLAGLLFAAKSVGGRERRYDGLIGRILALFGGGRSSFFQEPFASPRYTHEFELISGAAGLSIALEGIADERARTIKSAIDKYLTWLCMEPARWCAEVQFSPGFSRRTNNFGLSHGITGVVSALCLSDVEDADKAISAVVDYLIDGAEFGDFGVRWPAAIYGEERIAAREAWCYGTAGVAAVLAMAGKRLGRSDVTALSVQALEELWNSPRETWHLADEAICHGIGGIALCFESAGRTTATGRFERYASILRAEITDAFDANAPYGFRASSPEGGPCDDASFLTGAAGIALTLLSDTLDDRTWLRALGLF